MQSMKPPLHQRKGGTPSDVPRIRIAQHFPTRIYKVYNTVTYLLQDDVQPTLPVARNLNISLIITQRGRMVALRCGGADETTNVVIKP